MSQVCEEIAAYIRACERLLSKDGSFTEDERGLLEYYVNELSRELLSDKPTVRLRETKTAPVQSRDKAEH